ncbi:MAG TPA: DUF6265 family protein [Caulobacterales bacterium]|nr:DUF6265 family protein [Caulobacterales bacterium]
MKKLIALAALAFATTAQATTVDDLSWLKGCWRGSSEDTRAFYTEVWTAPPIGALLGFGYTWRDNQLREWEQLRIDAVGGTLGYVAMPGGGDPVRFALVEGDESHVVFANPAHDFPQRIEYARHGNELTATISGGAAPAQSFHFRKIDCPANLRAG